MSENLFEAPIEVTVSDFSPKGDRIKTLQKKPGLVMFYAHWCPHCQNKVNLMEELADKYDGSFAIRAFNCAAPENQSFANNGLQIGGYPTFKYASGGKGTLWDYEFDPETVHAFIEEKIGKNGSPSQSGGTGKIDSEMVEDYVKTKIGKKSIDGGGRRPRRRSRRRSKTTEKEEKMEGPTLPPSLFGGIFLQEPSPSPPRRSRRSRRRRTPPLKKKASPKKKQKLTSKRVRRRSRNRRRSHKKTSPRNRRRK